MSSSLPPRDGTEPGGASGRRRFVSSLLRAVPEPLYRRLKRVPILSGLGRCVLDLLVSERGFEAVEIAGGRLQGLVLDLLPRTNKDMVLGRYEPSVVGALQDWLGPGRSGFDVGAHVGYETLVMAVLVGKGGRVVAFEPEPALSRVLERNVERNRPSLAASVTAVPAAMGTENGRACFREGPSSGKGHLAEAPPPPEEDEVDIDVEVLTLDEAARRFGAPDLVKIDVEGAELGVLRGAQRLLGRVRPVFVVEAHSPRLECDCGRVFEGHGYRWERIGRGAGEAVHLLAVPTGRA